MRSSWMLPVLFSVFACAACEQQAEQSPTQPQASAAATSKPAAAGIGLANPANDPAVVALANKALACEWSNSGLKYDCPDYKAWQEAQELKEGKADPTLVNMLEDKDEKVRWLAAKGLASSSKYREDAALAKRVVAAADKETSNTVAAELGSAVSRIDGEKTGLTDALKKLCTDHKLVAMRRAVVSSFLFNNRSADNFDFVANLARSDKAPDVRRAAASSFWTGTPSDKNEDACKLWLELAGDADNDLAGNSAYHCAFYPHSGGCKGQWDALLALIEKKAADGTVQSGMMASALRYLYEQKEASDVQKKKTIAAAKAIVENDKNDASARGTALEFVGKNDPGGKVFAAKYKDDKEFFVKNAASRVAEGK